MRPKFFNFIFFTLLFLGSTLFTFAQTVNFNSYTENIGLSTPHVEGELEFEPILGTSAKCSICIGIDANEGKDLSPGLDDANFEPEGIKGWKISKADNSSFQFLSIWLQHRGDGTSTSGTIKAFKGGSQVGSEVNIQFNSSTDGLKSFSSNPDFYDVDEIRIEGDDLFIILDEITYGAPFTVGDADPTEVTAINLVGSPLSTATSVQYQVDFSKIAKNVSANDFVLTTTGTATGTIGIVTGSNATYNVPISGISGEGTLRLDLIGGTDITNENDIGGTSAFTSGQIHNVSPCLVEDFEDETVGSKTFSYGGFNFTITGNLEVYTESPPIGFNGSKNVLNSTGPGPYTINSGSGEINLRKFVVYLSSFDNGSDVTDDGSITVVGKNNGNTVYTILKDSGFPTDNTDANRGYYIFDLRTEGGIDNSDVSVDEIEIALGGAFDYINIDNFEFCADDVAPSGYSVTIDQDPITPDNDDAVSFTFAGAEVGTTYEYTFTSSGGGTPVTNTGTIITASDQITGIDLSGLALGTITLTVNLTDASNNEGLPALDQVQKRVVTVPTVTPPTAPVVTEDDVNVALAEDIQVADVDGDDQTLTFTITGGTVTLGTTGITFGGSGNGSASFTAAGTLAALNTALDAATFTPTPDLFGTGVATIEFVSNDGTSDSDPASVTFDIIGVNDAPVFDGNRIISYTEGGTAAKFNGGGNIGLSDIEGDDIIEAKITFNDKITGDILSVEAPSPYSVTQEGDVITLSGSGSVAQMIAALESIEYSHIGNDPTVGGTDNSRLISTVVKDASGLSSNILTVQVALTAVNNDPSIASLPTDITVQENAASSVNLSAATFGDPDAGANSITLEIAADLGILTASDGGGVTISNSGTGAITLSGAAAAIDAYFNTASNIQYTGPVALSGDNAATLTFTANDGGNTGTGGGTNVVLGTVNVDISNAPPTVTLSVSPSSKPEGVATDNLVIATLSNTYDLDVTVNLAFSGTATHSVDYIRSGATITIPAGSTTGSITFNNIDDNLYETNETVIVDITLVTYGTEDGVQQVTFTITEDDLPPTVSLEVLDIYNPITDESGGQAYVRAKLSAVAGVTVSVPLTFSGTATGGGTDYSITGSTISISSGDLMDSIRVTSLFDGIEEGDETIIIDMGTPTNGTEDGIQQVTLTIIDEDAVPPIGYSVEIDQPFINVANESAVSYTFSGAEVGATYNYTFSSDGGGTNVTGSGTLVSATDQITGIDLSSLADGTITLSVTLTDGFGNTGSSATDIKIKDTQPPMQPSTPDLIASSDSGISDSDDITNDRTPTLQGTAEPNTIIEIISSVDGSLGETTSTNAGEWEFTPLSDLSLAPSQRAITHEFIARAKDGSGNFSDSDPLTVVIDTKAPAPIIINGLAISLDGNGNSPTLIASDFLASPITDDFSDAADILLELDKNSFDCSNVGTNLIRLTSTDEAGNSDYAETTVTVQDNIAPNVVAKSSITLNVEAFGTAELLPGMVDEGSTDACGIISQTFSKSIFDRTDEGVNVIDYIVTDVNSNPTTVQVEVTIVVVPKVLTITADPGQSKLLGAVDPVFTFTADGFEGTDDVTILTGALSRAAGETIGTYAINQGDLSAGPNYTINFIPADFEIKKGILQLTGLISVVDKVYDATRSAFVQFASISLVGVDPSVPNVFINDVTAEFVDKNIGVGKEVRITSVNLTGADAASYEIDYSGSPASTATISPRALVITGLAANNKVYDGTTLATLSGTPTVSVLGSDDVLVTGTPVANFSQSDVGVAIPITVTGLTLDGVDKDNYEIIPPTGLRADITQATLSITANPNQSKVFGTADPIFTYSSSGFVGGETDAILTGALSRTTGEDKGTYPINLGTLDAGSNYTINFTGADFTIASKVLNVIANAGQMKVYGEADPIFTYVATGFESGDDESILTGALSRAAGENVGNYAINLGTLSAGDNYTINFTGADFTIASKVLNITADAGQMKVYGEADPIFLYVATGFEAGDDESILTGALSRAAGEDVGMYAIQPGTIDAGGNYSINFTSADFEITKATLSITANAGQSKVYGDADPVFTYMANGFKNGDTDAILSGSLIRFAGEDVGIYAIQPGTIDAGGNYTINFTSADFEITKASLAVTANAGISKIYGNADPTLTYQTTGFKNGDTQAILSGTLARAAGENVGNYAINLGTLSAGANYTINFTGPNFAITPRTLNVTANPNQAKVYGSADPVLAYLASNFGNGDTNAILTGALSRTAGENIGLYPINLGTLSAGSNYTINFTSADFEIAAKVLNVTAKAGQSKVFGSADPILTYTATGFENGDTNAILTGALSRAAGENVGNYAINLGTLSAGANYAINFVGADFEITKAMITGIMLADGSFVYDGTSKSLAISGSLPAGTAVAYLNNSRTDVGTQEVTATISGSNYTTLVLTADLMVTKAAIAGITFADGNFVFDGTAKSLEITGTLPTGASVAYTNNSRTEVGMQEVTVTISGSNFTELELTADLTITPAILTVLSDAGQSKLFGAADPELTFAASGFGEGDDESLISGTLSRAAGEAVGLYAINIGTLDAGDNYTIDFTGAEFEIISTDTDGDGVPDDIENEQGTDPTDPMDYQDQDGDGVPDYVEDEQGTDPSDPGDYLDTDGDDVPDYVEEQQGTDPNDITDFPDVDEDGLPDYVQTRSVTEFVTQSMEALWGTEPGDLKVPTEAVVITASGEFINLPVIWDLTGYDPMMAGTTTYLGTVDLPAGLFNPEELQPMLEITVLAKPAPQDVTLSANSFIGIPDQYFQEIGAFTVIDPTDNVHTLSLPEGVQDNEYFEVLDGILFWSSAEQAQGRTEFTVLLRVEDRGGNVLEKSFQIIRTRTPLDQLDVPNTFTPNGDGSNDTWGVIALRYYTGVKISIMAVGGERVFYTENPDKQWDGIFNGKEMPVGAYLYVIEVAETGEIRRGMLNLLRQ